MSFLIDTNVISELRKRDSCDRNVAVWWAGVDESQLYLSVLAVGEIRKGLERLRTREARRAAALEDWLRSLTEAFGPRLLPVTREIAEAWGRMAARRPVSTVDALMAATAVVHDLTLVTRNVTDTDDLGARVLNPFEAQP